MKSKILIIVLTFIWLVLIANIIWNGADGKQILEDSEKIGELEIAKYTNQIMVVSVSKEVSKLYLYESESLKRGLQEDSVLREGHGKWQLVLETEAIIGKNGLGKTKEGDGKTPIGVFLFVDCFGILENPGTKMEYTKVNKSHYWVDDSNSKYYNQFISTDEVQADWKSAEHIVEYGQSYHYVLATSYNSEGIPGVGSAVFLHCMSKDADATAGCVAIPEVYMREILMRLHKNCVLIIDYKENILKY